MMLVLLGRGIVVSLEVAIVVFEAYVLQQQEMQVAERLVLVDKVPGAGLGLSSAQGQQAVVLLLLYADGADAVVGELEKGYNTASVASAAVAVDMVGSGSLGRDGLASAAGTIGDIAAVDSDSATELAKGSLPVSVGGYVEAWNTPFGKT